MEMDKLPVQLLTRFMSIRDKRGENIDVGDAAMVISDLMDVIDEYNVNKEKNIYGDIKDISDKIKKVKMEIMETLPDGTVPEATQELDAVVKSTEDATNNILDSADRIREFVAKIPNAGDRKLIEEETVKIFEACNFQDITGQRIKKVTTTLKYIESAIQNILTTFEKGGGEKYDFNPNKLAALKTQSLMNGPQLEDVAPSQNDIDRLFDSV
jgi:chemotaxis protein CheZ